MALSTSHTTIQLDPKNKSCSPHSSSRRIPSGITRTQLFANIKELHLVYLPIVTRPSYAQIRAQGEWDSIGLELKKMSVDFRRRKRRRRRSCGRRRCSNHSPLPRSTFRLAHLSASTGSTFLARRSEPSAPGLDCALEKIQDFLPNLIKRTNLTHWHQHVIFGPLALPPVLVLSPSKSLDTFTCHVDQQLRCHRSFLALSTASCMTP